MGVSIDVDLDMRPMSVDLVFPKGIEECGRVTLNFWRSSCKYGTLGERTEKTTDRSSLDGSDVAIVRNRSAPVQFDRAYVDEKIKVVSLTTDGDVQCYLSHCEAVPMREEVRVTAEEGDDLAVATTETVSCGESRNDAASSVGPCDAWDGCVDSPDAMSDGQMLFPAQKMCKVTKVDLVDSSHEAESQAAVQPAREGQSLAQEKTPSEEQSLAEEKTPAEEQKPLEQKPLEQKPLDQKPLDQKPLDQKPLEQKILPTNLLPPALDTKGPALSIKSITFACWHCSYNSKDKEAAIEHCKMHIKGNEAVTPARNDSSQPAETKQSLQSALCKENEQQSKQNEKLRITNVFSLSPKGKLKMTADPFGLILSDDSKKFRVKKTGNTGHGALFTAVPLNVPTTSPSTSTGNPTSQSIPTTVGSCLSVPSTVSRSKLQPSSHPRSLLKRPVLKTALSTQPTTSIGSPKVLFKCFKCDHQTFDRGVALQHLNSHTVEKKPDPPPRSPVKRPTETYTCGKCSKTFRVRNSYMRHMRRHAAPKRYECTYCSRCFNNGSSLKVHVRTHTRDYPFKCDACSRGYMTEELLAKHKQQSHSDPVVCNQCNLPFVRERNLVQHMIRSHGHETPYKCKTCGSFFGEEKEMLRHEKKCGKPQKEDVSRRCLYCSFEGETYPDLCTHVAQCHPRAPTFKCSVCEKTFVHGEKLRAHMKIHKKEGSKRVYKCPECSKELQSQSGLQAHLCSHNSIRPFKCTFCNATLTSKGNLRMHVMNTHGARKHACDQCPKVCTSKTTLRRHIQKTHGQTLSHECNECHKRFTSEQKLQKHTALVHMGDTAAITEGHNPFPLIKPFSCDQCDFTTFSPYKMKAHKIMHTGVMPYRCAECDKSFVVQDELTRHNAICHSAGGGFRPCPQCKRVFIAEQRFAWHIKLHEMGGGFTCEVCNFLYESRAYLEHHKQSHSASSAFKCNLCDRAFKVSRALTVHKFQSHPETRKWHTLTVLRSLNNPHGCDQCLMRFKTMAEVKAHKLFRHMGVRQPGTHPVKRIPCTYCDRKFAYPSELAHHVRIHTGEKPYVCEHCSKAFRYAHSYRNHITVMHTKDFKVYCPLCKKGLVDNTKLKQHLKCAHKAVGETSSVKKKSADVQGSGTERKEGTSRKRKTQQQTVDESTMDTENAVALLTSLFSDGPS